MVIHRRSDSLSQCDPSLYTNIYDVRKRPDIKQEPIAATQPTHKDTIEISHDKLKEEALKRLRHTSKYVIAQNSFMRIGKYLFLAVALPPYLALYEIPKWIIVEGLPAIYSMTVWMWKKIQRQINKPIEAGAKKLIQITQFVQNLAKALIQPLIHFALKIQQSFRQRRQQVIQFFRRKLHKGMAALGFPHLKLKAKVNHLQERLSKIKEKWSQKVQQLSVKVQEGMQWVKDAPQNFLGWGQTQLQILTQRTAVLGAKWKARFSTSQNLAERATNWVSQKVQKGIDKLKSEFAPLVNFYRQQWQPRWQKISKNCQGKWEKTKDFWQQKHQKILKFIQKKQDKLNQLSAQRFFQTLLSHPRIAKLPLFWQKWLKKVLAHPFTRTVCDGFIKGYAFVAKCLLQIAKGCLHLISYGATFVLRTGNFIRKTLHIFFENLLSVLNIGQRMVRKGFFYLIYYFLLFAMISFILFIWGLRCLGNCMNEVKSRFSFSQFK